MEASLWLALKQHTQPLEMLKTIPFRNKAGPHFSQAFPKQHGLLGMHFKDKCSPGIEQHAFI